MIKNIYSYHHIQENLFSFFCVAFFIIGIATVIFPKRHVEGAIDSISYYALPAWNNTTLYRRGDFVRYQGGYYESLRENVDHRPDLNLGFLWQVLPSINEPAPLNTLTPIAPVRLFDISMTLDSTLLRNSSDLFTTIQFTSFGTLPTIVNLDYKILDTNGLAVYTEQGTTTIETEGVLSKDFNNLLLKDGVYTLVLTTSYGENVNDEFRQSFEVRGTTYYLTIYLLFITGLGIIGYIFYLLFIKNKNKTIYKIRMR